MTVSLKSVKFLEIIITLRRMVTQSTTISLLVNFQHRIGQEGNELNWKFNIIQTWPAFTSQISPDF